MCGMSYEEDYLHLMKAYPTQPLCKEAWLKLGEAIDIQLEKDLNETSFSKSEGQEFSEEN